MEQPSGGVTPPSEPPVPGSQATVPPPILPPAQPSAWVTPAAPTGWVAPVPAASQGGVSGLAKLGALFLFLIGLFWGLIGLLALVAGELFRQLFENARMEGLEEGQLANFVGGAIIAIGVVILVVAVLEVLVGLFAWRGSGFARLLGVLYGLFFGVLSLLMATGASRSDSDAAGGGVVLLAFGLAYLYTAVVFIFRWRSPA